MKTVISFHSMIGHVSWELVASLGNVELTTTGKKLQPIAAA
jgi:hypothetical protein